MSYIQNKLDTIDIFDYIVFEDGDIDKEKSNEKLKELLTGYHNDIVEKIKEKRKKEDFTKKYCPDCGGHYAAGECDCSGYNKALDDITSILQDTNK